MGREHTRSWRVGDVAITRIYESMDTFEPSFAYPDADAEMVKRHAWLLPDYATPEGHLYIWFQAFVVESRGRRIMVDTCIGNGKAREIPVCSMLQTTFIEDLAAAGFPPESMDVVLCTHLHFDHVGWNTRLVDGKWAPTFPNARYLFGRREWEHTQATMAAGPPEHTPQVADSIQPVIDAGLADFVEDGHRVTEEVWLEPTPGHTPGHVSVIISSRGQNAVITGDIFHNPFQMAEPDLRSVFCFDSETAVRTRRAFLERYQDGKALVVGSHFCDPTAGWVEREPRNWRFRGA